MQVYPVRAGSRMLLALVLLMALAISGCHCRGLFKAGAAPAITIPCPDKQTIDVNLTNGAQPSAIYVCEDKSIFWQANGHPFTVEFLEDSPFKGDAKIFSNESPASKGAKNHSQITVTKYKITVYDEQQKPHVFDPHVVGGGGL
jgi:hypothetical protein